MAKTDNGQDAPRVALAQVKDLMATSGQRGDALRACGLSGLAAVKRAKVVQTRRERARAAVRHGEDSERVARLDRQMAVEHRFLVNTRAEVDRIAAPRPERDSDAWQVHGYLRSQDGLSRAKYGVALLADIDGRKTLAETTTDKRGYFHMRLALKTDQKETVDGGEGKDRVEEEIEKRRRAEERDRVAERLVRSVKNPVYLGIGVPGQSGNKIDERALYPMAGAIAYRDLTVANPKDTGKVCQIRTRLLGNSGVRELHDLDNEKPGCQIAEIRPDQRFYVQSEAQAEALGYDFCAHCFGKQRSRR